ncbi:MAG TPA: hypothetical protein VGG36_03595 [Rhizomicrobium sp.]
MPTAPTTERSLALAPAEWLFLALVILGWGVFVVCLGKDMSWDFRNYHWYIPYAFLNGRMGFDVAVAHQASYYNPLLDVPFFLLASHMPAWFALGTLGAVQGANAVPLYLIIRALLQIEERKLAAAVLTVVCMTGGLSVGLSGTTYYDTVMSVFILSGLAILITQRETLALGTPLKGAMLTAIAGFLVGTAVGLKLPEAPYALGFAAMAALLPGDFKHRSTRLLAGGAAGTLAVAIFAGLWMIKIWHLTGNPLFPYFNNYFHSTLALSADYRDLRFVPTTWQNILLFPLLFSIDWRIADDLPFTDIRVGVAYIFVAITLVLWIFRRRARDPLMTQDGTIALLGFAIVSYIAWLTIFAIYRYIVLLEMIAPILIVATIGSWRIPQASRITAIGAILLLAVACTRYDTLERAPVDDPYIQMTLPPIPDPDHSMLLMTGDAPMGYIAPLLPPQIPILRIDGWMIQPQDGSKLTTMARARVKAFKGDLYVLSNEFELPRTDDALAAYGLATVTAECEDVATNLGGPYRFCPLMRKPKP